MIFHVGKVTRIILGKVQHVCACCALRVESCTCLHGHNDFDTTCPNRHTTF